MNATIQDFDTIVSSEISLEMEALNVCKDSLISMEIETFDRLRPGLNSFHGELLLLNHHTKGSEHMWRKKYVHFVVILYLRNYYLLKN